MVAVISVFVVIGNIERDDTFIVNNTLSELFRLRTKQNRLCCQKSNEKKHDRTVI